MVVAGGGIAGLTAALTAARLGHKTMVLTGDIVGGQLISIEKVDGVPGFPDGIPGYDLGPIAQEQAMNAGAEFAATEVQSLAADGARWRLSTPEGDYLARGVVLATGCELKRLGVPGEERLQGFGVSDCATCDGPLLKNKVVVVIGGGDSAMQEALTLANFASRVVMLDSAAELSGQTAYRTMIGEQSKVEIRHNTTVEEIVGEAKVSGVRIRDMTSGATSVLEASGVFVYIGLQPNAAAFSGPLKLDPSGAIPTDSWMRTALTGVCAAGTVRSGSPCRAASSAGDGAAAAIAIDRYLRQGQWPAVKAAHAA
jgi:thioredoxin reductase (NADPH)